MEKICHANTKHKKATTAISLSEKVDTKTKRGHLIIIKVSTHQDNITIINVQALNRSLKCMRQKLPELKGEMYDYTISYEDFNTLSLSNLLNN